MHLTKLLKCSATMRGICAIIGGVLIHLTLGNIYSFGNIMTYMASYMHKYVDLSITYSNMVWVNSLTTAAQGLFMVLGGLLERKIGASLVCFLGCFIMSLGILLTYFTINLSLGLVILSYGFLTGVGISLAYASPMACGMLWYPKRKGLVNGAIVAGFGMGSLGSTTLQTVYLNPGNLPPGEDGYFTDPTLLKLVPNIFLLLGCIFFVMQITGCLLLSKPDKSSMGSMECEEEALLVEPCEDSIIVDDITKPGLKPTEVIKERYFYVLWVIFLLNTIAIGYINSLYKSYGFTFISSDLFLSQVGSWAAVFNAGGRIVWGRVMDHTSFKVAMMIVTVSLVFLFVTLPLTQHIGHTGFALWIWAIFFTFSGTFVLMPTVTEKLFGSRYYSSNYGLLFTNQALSGPLVAGLNGILLDLIGYEGSFLSIAFLLGISTTLTFILPRGL